MHTSIESLRRTARLNFKCEHDYNAYVAIIEPELKKMWFNPLSDWQHVESDVKRMVRRSKGVFRSKEEFLVVSNPPGDWVEERLDLKAFRNTERDAFKGNIDHLRDKGILSPSCHEFLDHARRLRNTRLHSPPLENNYSEDDFKIFYYARCLVDQIHLSEMEGLDPGNSSEIKKRIKSEVESVSQKLLAKLREQERISKSTGFTIDY